VSIKRTPPFCNLGIELRIVKGCNTPWVRDNPDYAFVGQDRFMDNRTYSALWRLYDALDKERQGRRIE